MKNFKLEHNLVGPPAGGEKWPKVASVFLKGNKKAMPLDATKSAEHNEAVMETWEKVAVLRALAPKPTRFHFGFSTKNSVRYLKHEFKTDLKFAVRLGPNDVNFIALPEDIEDKILLEVVEITTVDDEKYKDLILI